MWVSIKIKKASSGPAELDQDPDINIPFALEKHYTSGPQDKPRYFVRPLDSFQHVGVNGTHNCLVTELLGPTLSGVIRTYSEVGETLRPDTVLRTSRQLLEGLEIAHHVRYVHGGIILISTSLTRQVMYNSLTFTDISPANIAFTCNNTLDNDEYLFEVLGGEPITANYVSTTVPRPAYIPKQIVKSANWALWYDSPEEDARIIDWGCAFPVTSTLTAIAQPSNLQSPETFFIGSFNYTHDLWRAGCVVCGILLLLKCLTLLTYQLFRSISYSTKRAHFVLLMAALAVNIFTSVS